jgi:phage gpG-like protein
MARGGSVARALAGLSIRDNITSDMLPKITFSPTIGIAASRIDKLGLDIRSFREPLQKSVQLVIAPSIVKNFDVGGRPRWAPLSEDTLEVRRRFGFSSTAPLIRTGALRRTMGQLNIWTITPTSAIIGGLPQKVWYGAIHQSGLSRRSMGALTKKHGGDARKAFEEMADSTVSAARSGRKLKGAKGINIPQRQFVLLQPNDVDAITAVFSAWLQMRIDKAWPKGGGPLGA